VLQREQGMRTAVPAVRSIPMRVGHVGGGMCPYCRMPSWSSSARFSPGRFAGRSDPSLGTGVGCWTGFDQLAKAQGPGYPGLRSSWRSCGATTPPTPRRCTRCWNRPAPCWPRPDSRPDRQGLSSLGHGSANFIADAGKHRAVGRRQPREPADRAQQRRAAAPPSCSKAGRTSPPGWTSPRARPSTTNAPLRSGRSSLDWSAGDQIPGCSRSRPVHHSGQRLSDRAADKGEARQRSTEEYRLGIATATPAPASCA